MVCVLNKIDAISIVSMTLVASMLTYQEELDLLYKIPNSVPISSKLWLNVDDELKEEMWKKLEWVPHASSADLPASFVCTRSRTESSPTTRSRLFCAAAAARLRTSVTLSTRTSSGSSSTLWFTVLRPSTRVARRSVLTTCWRMRSEFLQQQQ